jgi:hypothetical protein
VADGRTVKFVGVRFPCLLSFIGLPSAALCGAAWKRIKYNRFSVVWKRPIN